ncbi:MAG: purine-nucleoside phosphorylase [Lachnospiraceae bacterium]|nr:purine-nucleoside phosphorylase [Lachnospiraceae bacterium]MBQ1640752.1 purine-nucleoside phosphorylase [Lachnospiraceae bacterium]MBQ2317809.1 purine-nucleoside phosphorylase [Lachnospiraceae bacterium]MBQ2467348.1 purine-nucleoside phosphorylase [Lachnospiraceae bacterium]MBQ2503799.1 purine-nucleoside phosphorylase [Lachnospiraceae bacterium]
MNPVYEKLERCLQSVRAKVDFVPEIGLVLGSGLGDYGEQIRVEATVDYKDIEGFPVSTAPGHKGRFLFGYVNDVPVVCMQGRVHFYEGYEMSDVVLPIRLMKLLGAKVLFLTNAAGGVKTGFHAGDLMLITDQNAAFMPSPLTGPNIDEFGVRFPDMSHIYDLELQQMVRKCAAEMNIHLQEGVYFQLKGPNYETPAEVNMVRTLGGDAVGMSTAVEAIAANHMGMKIVGISCISNMAAGISANPLSEEEVIEAGKSVSKIFTELVTRTIGEIHKSL